jgi:hypothetical protein
VDVHGNNAGATPHPPGHNRAGPDRSGANDNESAVQSWLQLVEDRSGSSLDTAAERRHNLQRDVGANPDDAFLYNIRICSKGRLTEEMGRNDLPILAQCRSSVRPPASEVSGEEIFAIRHLTGTAAVTFPAVRGSKQDMVSRLHRRDRSPNFRNNSGSFMSKNSRQGRRIHLVADNRICVAYTGSHHLYEYFIRTKFVQLKLFNRQRLLRLAGYCCGYLHGHVFLGDSRGSLPGV